MKFPELNPPCPYPTVFFGEYIIPNAVKPNDIFVRVPIEWMVVEKDLQKKRALLVSKYAIDWEGFADCPIFGAGYKTSWDASYLRMWLNEDFYKASFSSDEKNMIIPIYNSADGGNEKRTIDKVFLLSTDEVRKYFAEEDTSIALEPMVDRVGVAGTQEDPIEITYYPTIWWTRTSGKTKDKVVCVDYRGSLFEMDSNSDEIGVRPAMWVKI